MASYIPPHKRRAAAAAAAADFRGTKSGESSKQDKTRYARHHVEPTHDGRLPQHPSPTRSATSASARRDNRPFILVVKILITRFIMISPSQIQRKSWERVCSAHTDSFVVVTTTRQLPLKQVLLPYAWAKDASKPPLAFWWFDSRLIILLTL